MYKYKKTARFTYSIVVGLVVMFLLTGCSQVRLGYKFADWIIIYEIDELFDLTAIQEEQLEDVLDRFHAWHKTEELPRLMKLLEQAEKKLTDGVSKQEIEWIHGEFDNMKARIVEEVKVDVSMLLANLSNEQIDRLEKQLQKHDEEHLQEYQLPDDEWEQSQLEKFTDQVEKWLGEPDPQQINKLIALYGFDREEQIRHHKQAVFHSKAFIELLRQDLVADEIASTLSSWILNPESLLSPDTREFEKQQHRKRMHFYLGVDRLITQIQREHLINKLRFYRNEFEIIHNS